MVNRKKVSEMNSVPVSIVTHCLSCLPTVYEQMRRREAADSSAVSSYISYTAWRGSM